MYREINYIYRRINFILDAAITGTVFMASMYLIGYLLTGHFSIPSHMRSYVWLVYPSMVLWPLLLTINGLYPTNRLRTFAETARIVAVSGIQCGITIFAMLFMFKLQIISRLFIVDFTAVATVSIMIKEYLIRWYLYYIRKSGANMRSVLVVGSSDSIDYIIRKIEDHKSMGLKLIGVLVPPKEAQNKKLIGHKVLGSFDDIEKVLHSKTVDNVIITTYITSDYEKIENIISHCEEEGVEVWLPSRIFHTKFAKPEGDELMEIPMFVFRTEPKLSWQLLAKIVMDRMDGLVFSVLTLPVVFMAAILVKLTSPGPAIFQQTRCGFHRRCFTMYKIRTMYADAEIKKSELSGLNIVKGPAFKAHKDPRITPLGHILRKTSIDELPQFWNILKGDMSLVGPRPPLPEEVRHYHGWQRRRLNMKPGMTGLLQVSGRSGIIDFDHWVNHDIDYIDNWSLWLDMKIIFKTIFVVLSMRGAK